MSCCFSYRFGLTLAAALLLPIGGIAHAEVASIHGGHDGLCGHRTANGERLNRSAMTAAHRTLPFGTNVRVCHSGCVRVRINDRGPWVRGRQIDLSPAAARAIGLYQTGHVTMGVGLIDNQVQIGHNVTIGTNCLICGKVGISGSVTIGDRVRIGGGAGIADHVKIGTEAAIGAASGVGTDVPAGRCVFGSPAVGIERALEQYRFLGRQKILRRKIKDIEARVEELERGAVSPR